MAAPSTTDQTCDLFIVCHAGVVDSSLLAPAGRAGNRPDREYNCHLTSKVCMFEIVEILSVYIARSKYSVLWLTAVSSQARQLILIRFFYFCIIGQCSLPKPAKRCCRCFHAEALLCLQIDVHLLCVKFFRLLGR